MAKIVSFVVCDTINNIPTETTGSIINLVSPQIALRPQFIPSNFSFGVAVGVADVDMSTENVMSYSVLNPAGKEIFNSGEAPVPTFANEDTMPKEHRGYMISIDIRNLVIESEGCYVIVITFNGEQIGSLPVPIYKREK